jgi:hypothetical protein
MEKLPEKFCVGILIALLAQSTRAFTGTPCRLLNVMLEGVVAVMLQGYAGWPEEEQ